MVADLWHPRGVGGGAHARIVVEVSAGHQLALVVR